jgi:hypothetical protein
MHWLVDGDIGTPLEYIIKWLGIASGLGQKALQYLVGIVTFSRHVSDILFFMLCTRTGGFWLLLQ